MSDTYAIVPAVHGTVRPIGLQRAHIASQCRGMGTCDLPGAPCRDSLQVPELNQAARELLGEVAAPRVESAFYRAIRVRRGR